MNINNAYIRSQNHSQIVIKPYFTIFFLLVFSNLFSQDSFKSYTQNITGTSLNFDMAAVQGGEFLMGDDKGNTNEKPAHKVKVSPFWMSTLEVSWDIFEPFISKDFETNKSVESKLPANVDAVTRPTKPYLDMTFGMGKSGYPALAMTQYNAIQFCKWLYTRTGVFYRLPTEAEWEYAAKQGMPEGFKLEDYAWFSKNSDNSTHKVGQKAPNKFGLFDILGNVSEWTYDQYEEDFYKTFEGKLAENPVNIPSKLYPHVVRGGSYLSQENEVSPVFRDYSDPSWKQIDPQIPKSDWWIPDAPFVGIRLVRPVDVPSKEDIMKYYDKGPIKDY